METRRMCPHCRAFITTRDPVCPYCHESLGPSAVQRDDSIRALGGIIPQYRFNTSIILLINAGLYIATVMYSMNLGNSQALMNLDHETLIVFGAKYLPALAAGQWWRLVTAGFLHGGLLHIAMNSWVIFDLGAHVEEAYGPARMLVVYFVSTVTGFYLSAVMSQSLSIGASAGAMGLIGAMIAYGAHNRTTIGREIRGMHVRWAVIILVLGFVSMMPTDNWAHIGGLVGGLGVGYIAGLPRHPQSPLETIWRVASWLCILLTGISFLKMYLSFAAHSA